MVYSRVTLLHRRERDINRKVHILMFLIVCIAIAFQPTALSGVTYWDVSNDWRFYSGTEANSGPIYFKDDWTAEQIQIKDDYLQLSNPTIGELWNGILGFQCPSNANMTIQEVVSNTIQYYINASDGATTYSRIYTPGRPSPASVTGASDWNYSSSVITIEVTHSSPVYVTVSYGITYTISLSPLYNEIEEGFYGLLTATAVNATGYTPEDNATFTVNGVTFEWNEYISAYYAQVRETTPQTVTYDTVDSFSDTENPGATAIINQTATVTWLTSLIDQVEGYVETGDWMGAFLTINTNLLGVTLWYSILLTGLSLAIYAYTGPEATLLAWMLGWGAWSVVVHGQAVQLGLIMLALGGGLLIAKMFQDRRAT